MRCRSIALAAALATGMISQPALAAPATAAFSVSATVVSGCRASLPYSLAMDVHTAAIAPTASVVTVVCNLPTPYGVGMQLASKVTAVITTQRILRAGGASPGPQRAEAASGAEQGPAARADTTMIIVFY